MEFTGERYIPCAETKNKAIEREHWQRYYFARDYFNEGDAVLDIASGEGYGSDFLAEKLKYVTGIDISQEAVEYAKEKYKRDNLNFLVGNITKIPIDDGILDGIVSFETIEHVDEKEQKIFLKETKRVLKHGGVFIVSCPNRKIASDREFELWGYENIYHKKEYEIEEFKKILETYYKNVLLLYQRNETNVILSIKEPELLKVIWKNRKGIDDTQNIIAICSDKEIDGKIISNIIMDIDNSYLNREKLLSDWVKSSNGNEKRVLSLEKRIDAYEEEKVENRKQLEEIEHKYIMEQQRFFEQYNKIKENLKIIEIQKQELHLNEEKNSKNEELIKKLEEENRKNRELIEKLKEKDRKNEELIKEAEEKNAYLNNSIKELKQSTCWKLTAPLRCCVDFLKRKSNDS